MTRILSSFLIYSFQFGGEITNGDRHKTARGRQIYEEKRREEIKKNKTGSTLRSDLSKSFDIYYYSLL